MLNGNIYIFDLRHLTKPIESSVVHSSMNAMDHAKWRDVKTIDAFGSLIGRCYCSDDVAALAKYNPSALNAACNVKFSPRYARKNNVNISFSELYWGMTAVGCVQSELTPSHATQFGHTSMNFEKNKIHFLNRNKICFKPNPCSDYVSSLVTMVSDQISVF